MAQIVINEISQNYSYNIGTNSYATVALPITSCWGPGYFDPQTTDGCIDPHKAMLEEAVWQRFPATQSGLESFVSTYRGPASVYRRANDYSYQMALTFLTAGYDVLVCRICPGGKSESDDLSQVFDEFSEISSYAIGDKVSYDSKSYDCISAITLEEFSTTKTYAVGDQVVYSDKLYKCKTAISSAGAWDSTKWDVVSKEDAFAEQGGPTFEEFSTTKTYAVGDYVTYQNKPYKCKTAISSAGAWDSTKWDAITDCWKGITTPTIHFKAKYPGTFGDNLQVTVRRSTYFDPISRTQKVYWSVATYVIDASGVKVAVENISLVFNSENATDTILHYSEVESRFWTLDEPSGDIVEDASAPQFTFGGEMSTRFKGGSDTGNLDLTNRETAKQTFIDTIKPRYVWAAKYDGIDESDFDSSIYRKYPNFVSATLSGETATVFDSLSDDKIQILYYKEWIYTRAVGYFTPGNSDTTYEGVYDLLKDKLTYNPNRIISPGWDDQDYLSYDDDATAIRKYISDNECTDTCKMSLSPMHLKIMDVAYYSRCATGFIDVPHIVPRQLVHVEDELNPDREGYIQKLARITPTNAALDVNGSLFHTHSAFFAPWGHYQYVGTSKMNVAPPSFLKLMIERAQILNQAIQYEWALPTNRKHNLKIGKLDYTVPKKLVDQWQKLDGASVNIIMKIPDLNIGVWGNSTLYEVPPATYQALANLSTRYLVNAVEDTIYRVGLGITFQYNNNQAYNKFYAGVTPLLDTMKNVGAIDDYYVTMAADINGLDQVNANTVIGKVYLVVNGVINDIIVDLIALPPGTDLNQYRS